MEIHVVLDTDPSALMRVANILSLSNRLPIRLHFEAIADCALLTVKLDLCDRAKEDLILRKVQQLTCVLTVHASLRDERDGS
jgi:hypothetical protein